MGSHDLIKPLQGVRAIAALMVILEHTGPIEVSGALGVVLFFVLSGFLLGRIYLVRDFNGREVWRYAAARFARIYPLFALVIVAAVALNATFGTQIFELEAWQIRRHLLMLGDNLTVWTIAVEVHFYALFILVWLAGSRGWITWPTLLIAYGLLAIGPFVTYEFPQDRINPALYLHIFVMGLLVARLTERSSPRVQEVSGYALPLALILFAATALVGVKVYQNPVGVVLAAIIVFTSVQAPESLTGRVLGAQPMLWLGEVSFGLYLLHRFVQAGMFHGLGLPGESWYAFALCSLLTAALASFVFRFYEAPMRKGLRRLAIWIEQKVAGKWLPELNQRG